MGVNTARVLKKLSKLPLKNDTRKILIKRIIDNKSKYQTKIKVYAWDVYSHTAREIFFSEKETIINWCVTHNIWEKDKPPLGAVFYSWEMPIKSLFGHVKDNKILDIPFKNGNIVPKLSTLPAELYKDLEQKPRKLG